MYSYLANPTATRETLERFELATRHRLGQNFLVNDAVIGHILALADLCPTDVVYEVGPGIGTLTVALLAQASAVVAVEADARLPVVLRKTCACGIRRLALVQGDALRVGPMQLRDALAALGGAEGHPMPTQLVANLPYQVAATVLLRTFEEMPSVRRAVVMVQSEVADRMAAAPGSKVYGAYTAKLALYGSVTGRFAVSPGSFIPSPHVSSSVVRVDRVEATHPLTGVALDAAAIARTRTVIDAAFAQRRKTLRNSLVASGFTSCVVDAACDEAGVDARSRAEALAPADFIRLAGAMRVSKPDERNANVKEAAAQQC